MHTPPKFDAKAGDPKLFCPPAQKISPLNTPVCHLTAIRALPTTDDRAIGRIPLLNLQPRMADDQQRVELLLQQAQSRALSPNAAQPLTRLIDS
jgi:hypothetical protein